MSEEVNEPISLPRCTPEGIADYIINHSEDKEFLKLQIEAAIKTSRLHGVRVSIMVVERLRNFHITDRNRFDNNPDGYYSPEYCQRDYPVMLLDQVINHLSALLDDGKESS